MENVLGVVLNSGGVDSTTAVGLAVDKYGNETSMVDMFLKFDKNAPSYEELYDHWLKTKQND